MYFILRELQHIIFDTCICGKQRVSHVLAISDVRNRRATHTIPTCPCRSREVQLIRSSLKVISQARNRNHRRDRAIDYTSPRAVVFPADAGATRYCCVLSKSASMHLGILTLSTESSFFGKGGDEGGGEGPHDRGTDRLFIPHSDGHVRASIRNRG